MYFGEQISLPLTSIQSWGFSFFAKVQAPVPGKMVECNPGLSQF